MKIVHLPKMGAGMEEATIIAWLVEPGGTVCAGEPLLQVETDKAVEEIVAPASGRLGRVLCVAGTKVTVDQELAEIL